MDPDVTKWLLGLLNVIVIGGVGWLVRGQAKHENLLTELKTTLIGIDGKNGIRGQVSGLEETVEEQWRHLSNHNTRITVLEKQEGAA